MKQIELSAVGQELTCTNLDTLNIVSDTIGQYEATVTLDSWWVGCVPIVRFTKYGIPHDRPVIDGKCGDFDAVLAGSGSFEVTIIGLSSDGERKTNNAVTIPVSASGIRQPGTIFADAEFERLVTEVLENDAAYERKSNKSTVINDDSTDATYPSSKAVYEGIVDGLAVFSSATPLFATSVGGMTDTTRIYCNTSDGYLYVFTGEEWENTGILYRDPGIEASDVPVADTYEVGFGDLQAAVDKLIEMINTRQRKTLYFTDITVTEWIIDDTDPNYRYRATIVLEGVTSTMYPEVIFDDADAKTGNFSQNAIPYNGGIHIYSKYNDEVTIPTIKIEVPS